MMHWLDDRIGTDASCVGEQEWGAVVRQASKKTAAIELRASELNQLPRLLQYLDTIEGRVQLDAFDYVCLHAPIALYPADDWRLIINKLTQLPSLVETVIFHPDVLPPLPSLQQLQDRVLFENQSTDQSDSALKQMLSSHREAGWCFNLTNALSSEHSSDNAQRLVERYQERLALVHLDRSSMSHLERHLPLLRQLPDVPWIIESIS